MIPKEAERERLLIRIDQIRNELAARWSWIAEQEYYYLLRRLNEL